MEWSTFFLLLGLAHFIKPTYYLVWTSAISFKSSGFGHKQVQNNKNKIHSPTKNPFFLLLYISNTDQEKVFWGDDTPIIII